MQLEAPSVAGRQLLSLHTQRQLRGVMNLQNLLAGLATVNGKFDISVQLFVASFVDRLLG